MQGFLADGTVFDSNVGGKPLQFTLGDGKVIPGWEKVDSVYFLFVFEQVLLLCRGWGGAAPGSRW